MRLAQTQSSKKRTVSQRDTPYQKTTDSFAYESDTAVLDELMKEADALLTVILDCTVGVPSVVESNEPSLVERQRQELWLTQQLKYYRVLSLNTNSVTENESNPEALCVELEAHTTQLQDAIAQQNTKNLQDQTLVKRVLQQSVVQSVVFPSNSQVPEDKCTKDLFIQRDQKVSEFLHMHERKCALESKLLEISQEITELRRRNRVKYQKLQKQEDEETPKSDQNLKQMYERNQQLRHVFQGLLLEGGVNWTKDPQLRSMWQLLGTSQT